MNKSPFGLLLAGFLGLHSLAWSQTQPAQAPAAAPSLTSAATAPVRAAVLLQTQTTWEGKPIAYPAGTPEVTALLIDIDPGADTGWHHHPVPNFAYLLAGELEVRTASGQTRRLRAGEAMVEVLGTVHAGRNPGTTTARVLVFYAGAVGQAVTIADPAHGHEGGQHAKP